MQSLSFPIFLLSVCLFFACNPPQRKINTVFYHWQTNLQLSKEEKAYCDSLKVKKIFVKAFDVDWEMAENKAIPKAILQVGNKEYLPKETALCVFITNSVWENTDKVEELAKKISQKLNSISDSLHPSQVLEIQIDSDWTPKTKEHYFAFLTHLKTLLPSNQMLSVTLRLHQIKYYEKTGVPPVTKASLMFYNMSDVTDTQTENSILNINIAQKYLVNFDKYPLHIDVILPTFSWGVLQRQGRFVALLSDFQPDSTYFEKKNEDEFSVTQSHYYRGIYLYEGDKIRVEKAHKNDLIAASQLLNPLLSKDSLTLGFYHLSENNIKEYPLSLIRDIYKQFQRTK